MLWLRASIFVLATVPMVLGDLTGNVTCVPGLGPKHLSNLKFEDFAMPFGVNTINNYCQILRDFYFCEDYLEKKAEKAPRYSDVFQYLTVARGYLIGFCDPESYFYQEYKKNEECFSKVLPFYYHCLHLAKNHQVYIPILCNWPKNESVANCKTEAQLAFCMADKMRKMCGKPDPALYYLLVQKTTHIFEVHCVFPELLDVRRVVGDLMAELFFERQARTEKESENANLV